MPYRLATPCGYCATRDEHTEECKQYRASLYPSYVEMPTAKQLNFISILATERLGGPIPTVSTRKEASEQIKALLLLPKVANSAKKMEVPTVDDGYYAVEWEGVLRFYRIKTSTKGNYAGRQFVNRYKSDYFDRVPFLEGKNALANANHEAKVRFAKETVHCYMCGRRLTDPHSMEIGIGPDCAAKGEM